jgi:hypothetical protein
MVLGQLSEQGMAEAKQSSCTSAQLLEMRNRVCSAASAVQKLRQLPR